MQHLVPTHAVADADADSLPSFHAEMSLYSSSDPSSEPESKNTEGSTSKRDSEIKSDKKKSQRSDLPLVADIVVVQDVRAFRFAAAAPLAVTGSHPANLLSRTQLWVRPAAPLAKPVSAEQGTEPADVPEEVVPFNSESSHSTEARVEETQASMTAEPSHVAFAARLSPEVTPLQPDLEENAPRSATPAAPPSSPSVPAPRKEAAVSAPADVSPQDNSGPAKAIAGEFAKVDVLTPHAEPVRGTVSSAKDHVPTAVPAPEMPAEAIPAPPGSSHDIRVRIPDNRGGAMDVRFLDTGGEIRVSVRTPDNNLAQTLRGNLNELTQHLSAGGIHTELWRPGATASSSQDSSHQSADYDANQSGNGSAGDGKQRNSRQQSKDERPRWLQEFELLAVSAKE